MPIQHSQPEHAVSRLWLAAAMTTLAVAVVFGARLAGLENRFYDLFQQYQYKTPDANIALITAPADAETWTATGFSALLTRLTEAGARRIIVTHPLYLPDVPDEEQVRALTELERQAARSSGMAGELQRLSGQLAGFRRSYDEQQQLIASLRAAGNVLIGITARDGDSGRLPDAACLPTIADMTATQPAGPRALTALRTPPAAVCSASLTAGILTTQPDSDGVIRRSELVFATTPERLHPSLALATLAANGDAPEAVRLTASRTVTTGQGPLTTNHDYTVLSRYYSKPTGGKVFTRFEATELLQGKADISGIGDAVVFVGATGPGAATFRTPTNPAMSAAELAATGYVNLKRGDYLLRAEWLPWLELALLLGIAVAIVFWVPDMPAVSALLIGLIVAMLILSIEAMLLLAGRHWLQLATVALFAAAGLITAKVTRVLLPVLAPVGARTSGHRGARNSGQTSQFDPLDMEFSVLRQQPATDDTKERMYQIAFQHGRAGEFAKAERILQFIASRDPSYKDVRKLLQKLSGRRQQKQAGSPVTQAQTTLPPKPRKPAEGPMSATLIEKAEAMELGERRTLGRYRIERKIGQGAMATVYLGTDPAIGRKVAIKTVALADEFDAAQLEDARLQFRREAESAGRLNHPNIIAIYDAGEDGDVSYLAMEYFEGVSLLKHAQSGDLLPASWVMELMALAADALDYAHRQNVVHRDIKPANIMYHAASDELKITDFGIARLTDSSRTKTGIILGTPSYMSPEQLAASGVTGQSDLYSLGVTMYQLLTGMAPFRADSIPKLMDKIMREQHQPVCSLRPDLPACVDAILTTALAKNPADRFSSGRSMAMALRECAKRIGAGK